MRKKTILRIERDLKKRAKRMHLGKERTGAYVYGTLRKIRGNSSEFRSSHDPMQVKTDFSLKRSVLKIKKISDLESLRSQIDKGWTIQGVRKDKTGYSVLLAEPRYGEKVVWGESFEDYTKRAFPKIMGNPGKIHPRIRETLERYGFFGDDEGRRITDKDALQFLKRLYKKIPKNQRTLDGVENAIVRYMGAKERQAYRELGRNPVNDVLEILTQDQILAEYKKGGEGQQAKLMFTSKPMSGMSASQLVRKIGNYNNFSWRRVSPFLGKLHFMNQSLTLPMTFRVGREYSPTIYIENVDMPRYANRLIEYARKNLKAEEASYSPVARRVRLWWD